MVGPGPEQLSGCFFGLPRGPDGVVSGHPQRRGSVVKQPAMGKTWDGKNPHRLCRLPGYPTGQASQFLGEGVLYIPGPAKVRSQVLD